MNKNCTKKNNPNWGGGKIVSSGGYIMLRAEGHPRATKQGFYVFEHILVMEKHIGRYLKRGIEVCHHKDGNIKNNDIDNLELLAVSEHHKKHPPVNPFKKGMKFTEDHKSKLSKSKKLWWKKKKAQK